MIYDYKTHLLKRLWEHESNPIFKNNPESGGWFYAIVDNNPK